MEGLSSVEGLSLVEGLVSVEGLSTSDCTLYPTFAALFDYNSLTSKCPIYYRFMIREASMSGFPSVIDTMEVSCKTRPTIAKLANKIYDTAWALKAPG